MGERGDTHPYYNSIKDFVSSPKLAFVLCCTSVTLLSLPTSWLAALKVEGAISAAYLYLLIIAILSFFVLCYTVIAFVFKAWQQESQKTEAKEFVRKQLQSLDQKEKLVIGFCVARRRQTIRLPIGSTTRSLCGKSLLTDFTRSGSMLEGATFMVPPAVWAELLRYELSSIVGASERDFTMSGPFFQLECSQDGMGNLPEFLND